MQKKDYCNLTKKGRGFMQPHGGAGWQTIPLMRKELQGFAGLI